MNKITKLLFLSLAVLLGSLFMPTKVDAYEGTSEIRSLTDEDYRCFAAVMQRRDRTYTIPVSCVNLIYPVDQNIYNYIMWGTPQDGSATVRLGAIGLGKPTFQTKKDLVALFVTTESAAEPKAPQGPVVMRGDVDRIDFLYTETSPTPTPTPEGEDADETPSDEENSTQLTTREKLILGLKRAGLISLFALVVIVGLVFVITRARG